MAVVQATGLAIAYQRVGQAPPLVLVHGATTDSRMWQPQLDARPGPFNRAVREFCSAHSAPDLDAAGSTRIATRNDRASAPRRRQQGRN